MTRTCSDCSAPISSGSKGRCVRCANSTPERRANASRAMRRKQADPNFPRGNNSAALKVLCQNPEHRARLAEAARKGNYMRRVPEGYRDALRKLHNLKLGKGEARRMLSEMIAADARKLVAQNLDAMQRKAERERREAY